MLFCWFRGYSSPQIVTIADSGVVIPAPSERVRLDTTPVLNPVQGRIVIAPELKPIVINPENQNVPAGAGTSGFLVNAHGDWDAYSNSSWCTVTPSGTDSGTLTAMFTANPGDLRIAEITITVTGLLPINITVTQDAGIAGVQENVAPRLEIYPNPTSGQVHVIPQDLPGGRDQLFVLDFAGTIIFNNEVTPGEEVDFDFTPYPGNYYFVELTTDRGTLMRKIIVDK